MWVRTTIALLAIGLFMAQAPNVSSDDLLQRGRDNYRAGKYREAITDLSAAADAILSPSQMQAYVNSGKFESLPKFETAIVYLTMAYAKLGRDAEAREQIQRLMIAEGIAPTYAGLPLSSDVADFENVARRLSPPFTLANASLRGAPPPPTAIAQVPAPVAPAPAPVPAPASSLTAEQQRELEARVVAARAAAEREAEERIAAERANIQKQMLERIAAEREAAEKEAAEKIASERAVIEKRTLEQIAQIRAAAAQEVSRAAVATIRRAEGMALAGDVADANAMYLRLLNTPSASRDLIAAVATGLYRTADYADALQAFQRLGTFARGEEDLRYYKAVSLFETGRFAEAKKELECALPIIELTEDVNRYREKIEQMP